MYFVDLNYQITLKTHYHEKHKQTIRIIRNALFLHNWSVHCSLCFNLECIMISEKKYLKALKIVRAYLAQIETEISELPKKKENYKSKEDLEVGDVVECIEVHGNSTDNLTKGKSYEVVRVEQSHRSKFFTIVTDKGKKSKYNCKNTQFKTA